MSTAEESIYDLIPKVAVKAPKPPMYRSQYPGTAPPTGSSFGRPTFGSIPLTNLSGEFELPEHKKLSSTWGPRESKTARSEAVLKKGCNTATLPTPVKFEYKETRKPAVPKREGTVVIPRSAKNFVVDNAVKAVTMKPRNAESKSVDYINKPDFGAVPEYLYKVKADVTAEKEAIRRMMDSEKEEEAKRQQKMRVLGDGEKAELLGSLKKKWDSINKEYQGMTHMTALDTFTKIRRKEQFESQLAELEKSIEKLSKKVVFVRDD